MERAQAAGVIAVLAGLGLLAAGLYGAGPRLPVEATACIQPTESPSIYGPTSINAATGNQRLAAGINSNGTVTVLKWPSPSFYDQVKYHTNDRSEPFYGADRNAGIFLGVVLTIRNQTETTWLRQWDSSQTYRGNYSDTVVTRYRHPSRSVNVTVTDVVAAGQDVLLRQVRVSDQSPAVDVTEIVAVENLNIAVSKQEGLPTSDWCHDIANTDTAQYNTTAGAIVHSKAGIDRSTGGHQQVAVAVGFEDTPTGHQVGTDARSPPMSPPPCIGVPAIGRVCLRVQGEDNGVMADAADGSLQGQDRATGRTVGALTTAVGETNTSTATLHIAAAHTPEAALDRLESIRGRDVSDITDAKEQWLRTMLADAPLPATNNSAIRAVSRRALITLLTNYDPDSGAIVASIATQPPYGLDWPRDGAYFNFVLDRLLQRHDMVRQRNLWYASLQEDGNRTNTPLTPPGHWAMAYYADGTVGGPIPWEIDETGYLLWTFWDHYRLTGNRSYLEQVYPAIRRGADAIASCRTPSGLQCKAFEDDNTFRSQTLRGASFVYLGLRSAARAAQALNRTEDAGRYTERATELKEAARTQLWGEEQELYGPAHNRGRAEAVWPTCLITDQQRRRQHLQAVWQRLKPSLNGTRATGQYEAKSIIALAKAADTGPEIGNTTRLARWLAEDFATPDTHIQGEAWIRQDGRVRTAVAQPHAWEQILSYIAFLELYPPSDRTERLLDTCAWEPYGNVTAS